MYMHPGGTRNRMSGTTMQKNVPKSEWLRRLNVTRVMPGFPAPKFTTIKDVEAHVGGETVQCLMCGKYYQLLLRHLGATHGMAEREYRDRFNVPTKYSLAGSILSEKRRSANLRADRKAQFDIARQAPRRHITGPTNELLKRRPNPRRWCREDFAWHIEQARTSFYRKPPPPGIPRWATFQKRLAIDPVLCAAFYAARDERPVCKGTEYKRKKRETKEPKTILSVDAECAQRRLTAANKFGRGHHTR